MANQIISIEDYICNLIAGRDKISNLYFAVDKAREIRNNVGRFCYKVNFRNIGNKIYKGFELVELDNKATCLPLSTILTNRDNLSTLDVYILVLLRVKNEFLKLFQARYRAQFIREQAKIFCYTFNNPLASIVNVNGNRLTFKNSVKFLDFFCQCENNTFDPLTVFDVNQLIN